MPGIRKRRPARPVSTTFVRGVEPVVPGGVGEPEGPVVADADEPRLAAPGRGVEATAAVCGGEDNERRERDEPATVPVEPVELFA